MFISTVTPPPSPAAKVEDNHELVDVDVQFARHNRVKAPAAWLTTTLPGGLRYQSEDRVDLQPTLKFATDLLLE
ncbi:hypothetical protein ACWEGE_38720 [Amycolatopsis sp. NPDC004747]